MVIENGDTSAGVSRRHVKSKRFGFDKISIVVSVILILCVLFTGGYLLYQSATSSSIDGSRYQAVFLTNGQVYFGKLKMINGGYMKLSDIYYLQAKTASDSASIQDSSDASSGVTLIKLGNEIHGPEDEMVISKDQILFFENMKSDSKVSESISEHKKQ